MSRRGRPASAASHPGTLNSAARTEHVRVVVSRLAGVGFLSAPRLVIFVSERGMPYAGPWEWVPDAVRAVLGIEFPGGVTSEVDRILSLGMTPTIVLLDGLLEVHAGKARDVEVEGTKRRARGGR